LEAHRSYVIVIVIARKERRKKQTESEDI